MAFGSLTVAIVVLLVIVLGSKVVSGSSSSPASAATHGKQTTTTSASSAAPAGGTAAVPILIYHVINVPPPTTSLDPTLYVPADEFSSQMQALKSEGWHAVTLDQLEAYWTHGRSLGPGKPIVITFDGGYASQYTNALPILKRLGWVGVENFQLDGLSASDGGLSDAQVRGLVAAGWELDSQGVAGTDLITLDPTQVQPEVSQARQTLRSRYGVPANWFSYPSGSYNPTVTAAVRAAGFVGSTTVISGWAAPQQDRFRLPRVQVAGGTTASQLLAQIASAKSAAAPPLQYSGSGTA